MKQACWHSRRSNKAYRGLPEARMAGATVEETAFEDVNMRQAPVSQKPPLWEPRMWQGQVWEARPDGESTRGKAKFGKRHGSRKWEEENSATRRRHREKGGNGNPLPHTMCHTPHWASAGRVAFYYFVFLKRRKCIRGHFWWFLASAVVLRKGSPASAGASASIRASSADMWIKIGWFFRTLPCDVAA